VNPVMPVVVGLAVEPCVGVEMVSVVVEMVLVVVEMGKGVDPGVGDGGAAVVEEAWRR